MEVAHFKENKQKIDNIVHDAQKYSATLKVSYLHELSELDFDFDSF